MKFQVINILFICLLFSGCSCKKYTDHIELFKAKHPTEAKEYSELYQVSITASEKASDFHHKDTMMMLDIIEKYKDDPKALQLYIDHWRDFGGLGGYLKDAEWWIDIKAQMKSGDTVCEYTRDPDGEAGIIILRNGNIVFRRISAGNPDKRDFDNR